MDKYHRLNYNEYMSYIDYIGIKIFVSNNMRYRDHIYYLL
jgi:hypothetical protein